MRVWTEQDIISLQLQSAIFKDGCSEILNWKEISIAEFLIEFLMNYIRIVNFLYFKNKNDISRLF